MAFGKGAGIAKSTKYVLSWGSPFMSTARSRRKQFATRIPKSKTQNPKPKTQNPKSKTQHQNSKNRNPKSKILNAKRPPRARNPTTFKASRPLPAAGGSGRQLATSTLNQILQTASGSPSRKLATSTFMGFPLHVNGSQWPAAGAPGQNSTPSPLRPKSQNPKPENQNPKSNIQNPKSKIQNPKPNIQNKKPKS